jgi:type III secretion system low calcium response chaperone LcrH/SycD
MRLEEVIEKLSRHDRVANKKLMEGYLEDFIPNQLLKSENLQKAFGISDLEMESMYREGYMLYQKGDFVKSLAAFEAMVILDPLKKKFWLGFGASNQLLKKFDKALSAYAMAAILDTKDPYPHFHAYECYMGLKDEDEAKKALQNALEKSSSPSFNLLQTEIMRIKKEKKWQ